MRELNIYRQTLLHDLRIYVQHKSECLATILFFLLVVMLFPLTIGPWPVAFLWLVPCIIWISALLATVLAQEDQMRNDYRFGIFEQLILAPHSMNLIMLIKMLANWLVTGLPIVMLTPLLALSFALPWSAIKVLTVSLLLGTPILSLVGTIGAALTISLPRGGILLAVLILPLYIPVLILGTSATVAALQGFSGNGQLALLGALLILTICLTPLAVSAAIKASMT